MLKTLLLTLLSFNALAASWSPEADYLCFLNNDREMETYGTPGLGWLATKEGACQGMAGLASAFKDHAVFSPRSPKLSEKKSKDLITRLRMQFASGCPGKIVVPGYKNLREFCEDYRAEFLKQSVGFNADIAVLEIARELPTFLSYKDNELKSDKGRLLLHQELMKIQKNFQAGRSPLLLIYRHVRSVVDFKDSVIQGKRVITVKLYEVNDNSTRIRTVKYARDGLPEVGNTMVWDVTPARAWSCP